jgi:gamma-glutamyltranspeptidase/glutathione hydrolase
MRRGFFLAVLAVAASQVGPTELERGTAVVDLQARHQALGHDTRLFDHSSGLRAIIRTRSGWIGGADPRRAGTAAGD